MNSRFRNEHPKTGLFESLKTIWYQELLSLVEHVKRRIQFNGSIYSGMENLVLWTRSEITGSATFVKDVF